MTDEQLKSVLRRIDISECEEIIDNYIYYIKMPVRQRFSRSGGGIVIILMNMSLWLLQKME